MMGSLDELMKRRIATYQEFLQAQEETFAASS
jgi:hypothetical protein